MGTFYVSISKYCVTTKLIRAISEHSKYVKIDLLKLHKSTLPIVCKASILVLKKKNRKKTN
mgnify:CR=1 FL=1